MNKFVDEVCNRIEMLFKIYESFIWKRKNRNLAIVFQENMILTFYLFEGEELIDELHLSFDKNERDLYKTLCLRTLLIALGNVYIHKYEDDMLYCNEKRKPYLAVISKDEEVSALIDKMIANQDKAIVDINNDVIKETSKSLKKKVYSKKFLDSLDTRIDISNEIFKRW